jgi:hypothetical protein
MSFVKRNYYILYAITFFKVIKKLQTTTQTMRMDLLMNYKHKFLVFDPILDELNQKTVFFCHFLGFFSHNFFF